ncbi:transposase family protein [Streptomyces sp. NBC_00208]|uniref:integrase catalytic domain-containing protein n=1 Tax=Streptomyces sp. NBC_00208 TaxID=2975681 RepID=UPI002E2B5B47|nr:transposase family protein [Streptomyces sp. NBC_00208]
MPAASVAVLRGPAVRRLLALRGEQKLTTGHVRLVAEALQMTERTVWRWLAAAERDEAAADEPGTRAQTRDRFAVTPEVRGLLALWKGNVAAVHRELTARAARQSPPADAPPSLPTLHRAIHRDLTPGERAGLAGGERAARKHDVFLARPRGWRNQVWETDHVQAPVLVDVGGTSRRPWITWFTDCATNAITGVAVTPGHPSRESVLAALRSAVLREDPYGPFGGLPEKVRVDRGKDFLSRCWATLKMPTGPALKVPITEKQIAPLGWSQRGDCRRGVAVVGKVPRRNQSNFMPKYGSGSPV